MKKAATSLLVVGLLGALAARAMHVKTEVRAETSVVEQLRLHRQAEDRMLQQADQDFMPQAAMRGR